MRVNINNKIILQPVVVEYDSVFFFLTSSVEEVVSSVFGFEKNANASSINPCPNILAAVVVSGDVGNVVGVVEVVAGAVVGVVVVGVVVVGVVVVGVVVVGVVVVGVVVVVDVVVVVVRHPLAW